MTNLTTKELTALDDQIKTEQVLGTVDTIAGETVFHFEIWDDRTIPQDPERWLRPR